jgi:hypothetical protein
LREEAHVLWLEDGDQSIRGELNAGTSTTEPPFRQLGGGFVGFRTRNNYRSPETIARYIQRVLPFDFGPANPLPGLGVGLSTYKEPEEQANALRQP